MDFVFCYNCKVYAFLDVGALYKCLLCMYVCMYVRRKLHLEKKTEHVLCYLKIYYQKKKKKNDNQKKKKKQNKTKHEQPTYIHTSIVPEWGHA